MPSFDCYGQKLCAAIIKSALEDELLSDLAGFVGIVARNLFLDALVIDIRNVKIKDATCPCKRCWLRIDTKSAASRITITRGRRYWPWSHPGLGL